MLLLVVGKVKCNPIGFFPAGKEAVLQLILSCRHIHPMNLNICVIFIYNWEEFSGFSKQKQSSDYLADPDFSFVLIIFKGPLFN